MQKKKQSKAKHKKNELAVSVKANVKLFLIKRTFGFY